MTQPARTDSESLSLAVVAAYPSVRAGLRALLSTDPRIQIAFEATTIHDLLRDPGTALDVAVVDLEPDRSWGVAQDLLDLAPDIGIVLLGPDAIEDQLAGALGDRPWAYLLKEAGAAELTRAVEAVAAGLIVIQPPLARRLLAPAPATVAVEADTGESLTAREHEVLQLVSQGLPNKVIALRLQISEHTVKFHITSILSKLGASSRTEAVRLGARRGLIVL